METQQDFKELLTLLNAHKVEYIIVGGYAMAFHGVPRYTGDIDLYIKPDNDNAKRILEALNDFGFGSIGLTVKDFISPNKVIQLGVPPVRVDIITSVTGLTWDEADAGKSHGKYDDITVYYLGRDQLIQNKIAIGRKKDQADIEALSEK